MSKGTVQREQIYVYDTCSSCGDTNVLVYELDDKLVCANDYRKAVCNNRYVTPCDICGAPNAMRDPIHRRNEFLCWDCQQKNGFIIKDSVIRRALASMHTALTKEKVRCYAAGYGSDCDNNVKPRSAWGGKMLCNVHGRTPPKPEKGKKS